MATNTDYLEQALDAFTLGKITQHQVLAEFDDAISSDPQTYRFITDLLERFLNEGEITITAYKQIKAELSQSSVPSNITEHNLDATDGGVESDLEATVFSSIETDKATPGPELGTDQNNETSIDLDTFMEEPDIEFGESEGADATPGDVDATQTSSGNLDGDATQVAAAADDDATQMMADNDATAVVSETSGSRGTSSVPGHPQTTGSSWSDPSTWEDNPEPLGVGSVIKDRFELTQRLGIGGMGVVYKALDRRKVEAEDRDPYLAVKILNDEFKQHPKALQALQREARKTQELAHPNIMTVYDFDRVGSDVYMTMEFLDGDPMDVVIKKRKGKPFPEAEAMVMIEGMCEALAYAHRRNLVHSDFKPGNVFLTNKGTIKVLDFGIAQRVTNPLEGDDDGADKTVFDVKQFGAFTPAYATCEIMEGAEPDPRDDIYALGCVAYQLLGGKHPFNRKRATFARDNGLTPEPIETLSRRQQKALLRSLAFSHGECTPTVEEFIDGLRRKKSRLVPILIGIAAVLAVVAIPLYDTLVNYQHQQKHDQIMLLLQSGDGQQMIAGLDEIARAEGAVQVDLIADGRELILSYYEAQTALLIDGASGSYDFPGASALVEDARQLYPDSAQIERMLQTITSRRSRLLNEFTSRFNSALESGSLLANPDGDDITDVLNRVAQVDPAHPLLNDPRLPPAYIKQAQQAAITNDYLLATAFIGAGLTNFPKNLSLINARDEISGAEQLARSQIRVSELMTQIKSGSKPDSLADYEAIREPLLEIKQLAPDNQLLAEYQQSFQLFVPGAIDQLITAKNWTGGESALSNFGELLKAEQIVDQQQKLSAAKHRYDSELGQLMANFEAHIGGKGNRAASLAAAEKSLALLTNFAPADDQNLLYARNRLGYSYVQLARLARIEGNLSQAMQFAEQGNAIKSGGVTALAVATEIALSSNSLDTNALGSPAELEGQISKLLATTSSAEDAAAILALVDQLSAVDPSNTLIKTTRASLANALAAEVSTLIEKNQWEQASLTANQARLLIPELAITNQLVANTQTQRLGAQAAIKQQQINQITGSMAELLADPKFDLAWQTQVSGSWRRLRPLLADSPAKLKTEESKVAEVFLASALQSQTEQMFVQARNRLTAGRRVLPGNDSFVSAFNKLKASQAEFKKGELLKERAGEIAALKQTLLTQADAKSLTDASATFAKIKRLLPASDPYLTDEAPNLLAPTYLELAEKLAAEEKYVEALKLAKAGLRIAPNQEILKSAHGLYEDEAVIGKLAEQFAAARGPSSQATKILSQRITSTRQRSPVRADAMIIEFANLFAQRANDSINNDKPAYRAWLAKGRELFPTDTRFASTGSGKRVAGKPCTTEIAGYGKRKAGICYDVVAQKNRGPLMVVIPSDQPFAISKYEISRQDFDLFCSESGKCSASGSDPKMPVTEISFDLVNEYTGWLSTQTGKTYRLPNDDEWVYAATGDGNLGKDFNCLLKLGGNVIKGANMLPINSGKANNWGLHNPVGNVQEWTADGTVRGGAHKDTMSNCDISLKRNHSGGADEVTGFRILQELQG